jgi:hypothetical protein
MVVRINEIVIDSNNQEAPLAPGVLTGVDELMPISNMDGEEPRRLRDRGMLGLLLRLIYASIKLIIFKRPRRLM